MHFPKINLPELVKNKTYRMTFIMSGVNNSIGKHFGLGMRKGSSQYQKFSIKKSWSFVESEEVVNNTNHFNFFLRLQGENANHATNKEIDVL